jgi:enoyl-CoA hydratase/carnithine racemase
MTSALTIDRRDAAAVLTIDRPQAGNSISADVIEALEGFFHAGPEDETLRAVVITGAGERFFAAGGDVKRYRALESREQLRAAFERPRRLMDDIEVFPLPVIAAVNGWALWGGAELMLACDLRVIAPHARVGFPYVKLSLIPGWYGAERLVAAVGETAARDLLLRGEPVGAEEALRLGLVTEVAGDEGALARSLAIAADLATKAPLSMGAIKRLMRAVRSESGTRVRAIADREFEDLWVSEDHREAEAAFAAKREPRFRGC